MECYIETYQITVIIRCKIEAVSELDKSGTSVEDGVSDIE